MKKLPIPLRIDFHRLSLDVSDSIPVMIAFFNIRDRKLNNVAIASLMDVASKLYIKKINIRPMVTSKSGELNMASGFVSVFRIEVQHSGFFKMKNIFIYFASNCTRSGHGIAQRFFYTIND